MGEAGVVVNSFVRYFCAPLLCKRDDGLAGPFARRVHTVLTTEGLEGAGGAVGREGCEDRGGHKVGLPKKHG